MASNGFGGLNNQIITPNPEDRQWGLDIAYHFGNNPNDSVTGVSFLLPPGALVTGGSIWLISPGGGTLTVLDNQSSQTSLFGTVQTGAGEVTGTTVTAAGSGYTSGATVTFSAAPTGGTTATGTVTVVGGDVTGIVLTNPGSGYTSAPTVTIAPVGAGSGATATAAIQAIASTGRTGIVNYAYYPSGATLTVAANSSQAMIQIAYVVDGRANEVFGQDV
jgi:hypothetical protein